MKKKPVKKVVKRVRKPKVLQVPQAPSPTPEPGPFFRSNPGAQRNFTENPTKAAIDATYGYLKRGGLILDGSPVHRRFGAPVTKLDEIRSVLRGK